MNKKSSESTDFECVLDALYEDFMIANLYKTLADICMLCGEENIQVPKNTDDAYTFIFSQKGYTSIFLNNLSTSQKFTTLQISKLVALVLVIEQVCKKIGNQVRLTSIYAQKVDGIIKTAKTTLYGDYGYGRVNRYTGIRVIGETLKYPHISEDGDIVYFGGYPIPNNLDVIYVWVDGEKMLMNREGRLEDITPYTLALLHQGKLPHFTGSKRVTYVRLTEDGKVVTHPRFVKAK